MIPGDIRSPIPSAPIDALLALRDACAIRVSEIERLVGELDEIAQAAADAHGDGTVPCRSYFVPERGPGPIPRLEVELRREPFSSSRALAHVDRELWGFLMAHSGLWGFLDATARREWTDQLEGRDGASALPAFSREAVAATFEAIHGQRMDFVARGVLVAFERLSHMHATNGPKAWGRKAIRAHALSVWHRDHAPSERVEFLHELDDLDRLLRILRRVPEAAEHDRAAKLFAEQYVPRDGKWTVEFPFFSVRCFRKGTAHITFRHDEDVARLNATMAHATGKAAIPAERRRRA